MVWTVENDVPDMSGKVVVITGASSGIGLEAARIFVKNAGAHVVMGCRNLAKAQPFADELNAAGPGKATLLRIDTTELDSVDEFVKGLSAAGIAKIDVLALNAGVMFGPWKTAKTRSSVNPEIENMMATNHLGHFYLTHLLLPVLTATPGARIIVVSSVAARMTQSTNSINYDVVFAKTPEKYNDISSYAQSKLANLLLVHELQKRLSAAGADTVVLPCHPGYSNTGLQVEMQNKPFFNLISKIIGPFVSQDAVAGSLPIVAAATVPKEQIPEKPFYGPNGMGEMKGSPVGTAFLAPQSMDSEQMAKLFEASEEACGIKFAV